MNMTFLLVEICAGDTTHTHMHTLTHTLTLTLTHNTHTHTHSHSQVQSYQSAQEAEDDSLLRRDQDAQSLLALRFPSLSPQALLQPGPLAAITETVRLG